MTGRYRSRRMKLKRHDAGQNRHNRGLSWMLKANRAQVERGWAGMKRKRRTEEEQ